MEYKYGVVPNHHKRKQFRHFESITISLLTSTPWYVSNNSHHNDLNIETVNTVAFNHYKKFHTKLATHTNLLIAIQGETNNPENPPSVKKMLIQGFIKSLTI